jgi:LemA protein
MLPLYLVGGVVVLLVASCLYSYNRFVSQRQLIDNSWSNVDTELQRRHDLIPNLVNTVKGYAAHESAVLNTVTEARSNALSVANDPAARSAKENVLTNALKSVFAVAENYPDLKASENFQSLQLELANTEDRIQAARRFFNNNVRDYNMRVEKIPSSIIASVCHFTTREYFQLESAVLDAGVPPTNFS